MIGREYQSIGGDKVKHMSANILRSLRNLRRHSKNSGYSYSNDPVTNALAEVILHNCPEENELEDFFRIV